MFGQSSIKAFFDSFLYAARTYPWRLKRRGAARCTWKMACAHCTIHIPFLSIVARSCALSFEAPRPGGLVFACSGFRRSGLFQSSIRGRALVAQTRLSEFPHPRLLSPRPCRSMAALLRREQLEDLRQIFDLFDSDGDGLLEVEEVGAIWASCGTLLTEAEVCKPERLLKSAFCSVRLLCLHRALP